MYQFNGIFVHYLVCSFIFKNTIKKIMKKKMKMSQSSHWSFWFVFHLWTRACNNQPGHCCHYFCDAVLQVVQHVPVILILEDFHRKYKNQQTQTDRTSEVYSNWAGALIPHWEGPQSPSQEISTPTLAQTGYTLCICVHKDIHRKETVHQPQQSFRFLSDSISQQQTYTQSCPDLVALQD